VARDRVADYSVVIQVFAQQRPMKPVDVDTAVGHDRLLRPRRRGSGG
jgi:hypothetical protein